jgi:hypothetical protein
MSTSFKPPYPVAGHPCLPPHTRGSGATTSERASVNLPSGDLQLYTAAMVTLKPGWFSAQATAATAAKPFVAACFKTKAGQKAATYTLHFDYEYAFQMLLQGGSSESDQGRRREQHVSRAMEQVIAEVYGANNQLVADAWTNLFAEQAISEDIGPLPVSNPGKQLTLTATLQPNTEYYWKFSFYAGVCTGASGTMNVSTKCSCTADPRVAVAGPGGGGPSRGVTLKQVTVAPDVTSGDCSEGVLPSEKVYFYNDTGEQDGADILVDGLLTPLPPVIKPVPKPIRPPVPPPGGNVVTGQGDNTVIEKPDGTIVVITTSGTTVVVRPDGGVTVIPPTGGTVRGGNAASRPLDHGGTVTGQANNTVVTTPSGTTVVITPSGTTIVTKPDCGVTVIPPTGGVIAGAPATPHGADDRCYAWFRVKRIRVIPPAKGGGKPQVRWRLGFEITGDLASYTPLSGNFFEDDGYFMPESEAVLIGGRWLDGACHSTFHFVVRLDAHGNDTSGTGFTYHGSDTTGDWQITCPDSEKKELVIGFDNFEIRAEIWAELACSHESQISAPGQQKYGPTKAAPK